MAILQAMKDAAPVCQMTTAQPKGGIYVDPKRLKAAAYATFQMEPLLGLMLKSVHCSEEEPVICSLTHRAKELNAAIMAVVTADGCRETNEIETVVFGAPREEAATD